MRTAWKEFLLRPASSAHAVQLYLELDELADSVGEYFTRGFELGEPAVLAGSPERADAICSRLESTELLVVAEAAGTLREIVGGEAAPSRDVFERVAGGLLDQAEALAPGKTVRVFGEMVDVLSERGERAAAEQLEQLWNDLARRRRFSLLCAYHLDVFDREAQAGVLPGLCRSHSHVQPAPGAPRFSRAVERALDEVLGPGEVGKIYVVCSATRSARAGCRSASSR